MLVSGGATTVAIAHMINWKEIKRGGGDSLTMKSVKMKIFNKTKKLPVTVLSGFLGAGGKENYFAQPCAQQPSGSSSSCDRK